MWITVAVGIVLLISSVLGFLVCGNEMLCIDDSSLCPLAMVGFILFFSITDLRFPESGKNELHTSDRFFTYEEKVKMYKSRGMFFLTAIIPEMFLCFYFAELLKCLLAIIILCLFFGLSIVLGHLSIKKTVNKRRNKEIEELKKQRQNEELGRSKNERNI